MKYGRRPPKNAPALQLSHLLTGVVPTHPASADYLADMGGGWNMLGNDRYGDCVAVTWANERRLVSAMIGAGESYPTLAQVETLYKTQNPMFPSDDNGMDIQTCLEYLVRHGGPDGVKALAFAQVDVSNVDEVKAAIALFGCVWVGCNVLNANMDEFNAGEPWDYSRSPLDGGHSVVAGGYGQPGAGALGGDERFITWAAETSFTDDFWAHQVEEAWVVVWPEHLGSRAFLSGVSVSQLAADYTALTGKPFPITPVPLPTDAQLAAAQKAWEATLNPTAPQPRHAALRDANRAWRATKHL